MKKKMAGDQFSECSTRRYRRQCSTRVNVAACGVAAHLFARSRANPRLLEKMGQSEGGRDAAFCVQQLCSNSQVLDSGHDGGTEDPVWKLRELSEGFPCISEFRRFSVGLSSSSWPFSLRA